MWGMYGPSELSDDELTPSAVAVFARRPTGSDGGQDEELEEFGEDDFDGVDDLEDDDLDDDDEDDDLDDEDDFDDDLDDDLDEDDFDDDLDDDDLDDDDEED